MNSDSNSPGENPWEIPQPGPKPPPGPERAAWLDLRLLRRSRKDIEDLLDRIGPELRKNQPKELDNDLVAEKILEFLNQVTLKNPRAIVVRVLLQHLHAGFSRYCRHHKIKSPRIPLLADLGLEDGLLDGDTLEDYRRYLQLVEIWMQRFAEWDALGEKVPTRETASLIVMSAILFGGLPEREHWKALLTAKETSWLAEGDCFWFEYSFVGNAYRWIVDPVTESLWRRAQVGQNLRWPEIVGTLTMRAILTPYGRALEGDQAEMPSLLLERAVRASLVRHYAPDTASIAMGRLPNAALPRSTWRRILSGQVHSNVANVNISVPIRNRSMPRRVGIDSFVLTIFDRIKTAVKWDPEGKKSEGLKSTAENEEQRTRYIAHVKTEIGAIRRDVRSHYETLGEDGTQSFAMAIYQFVADIVETGGPVKEKLSAHTIDAYTRELLKCLPGELIRWIPELTADDRQKGYCDALNSIGVGSRTRLEVAIQLFERTLLAHFDVEDEVDWSTVPLAKPRATVVDANLVDPATYQALLQALEVADCDDDAMRRMYVALSIILYRFGPRRQDAHELTLADLRLMPGNQVTLRITKSRLTSKKSGQAVREIGPVILPEAEWRVLDQFWRDCAEEASGRSDLRHVYLFSRPGHGSQLLSSATLFDPITKLLRAITGDESIRIHHFRHGFESRLFISGRTFLDSLDELPHRPAEWKDSFAEDAAWLLAFELGHVSPAGPITTYMHTECIAHYFYACHLISRVVPMECLSKVAGLSSRSLERQLNRQKSSGESSLPPVVDFMLRTARRAWSLVGDAINEGGRGFVRPKVRIQLTKGDDWSRPAHVIRLRFSDAIGVMGDALVRRLDVTEWEVKGVPSTVVRRWTSIAERMVAYGFFDGDRKRRPMLSPAVLAWGERLASIRNPDRLEAAPRLLCRSLVGMQHRGHDLRIDRVQANELAKWMNAEGSDQLKLEILDRPEGFVRVHLVNGADSSTSSELRTFLLGCCLLWLTESDLDLRVKPYLDR
jgi:integrase